MKAFRQILVVMVIGLSSAAVAQVPEGSIVGTVTDASGATVPGAKVTLREKQTGLTRVMAATDAGAYDFLQIPFGTYEVAVEAKGFQRAVEENILVHSSAVVRVDVKLEVGQVTQTVEVKSQVLLIQPDKTSIGHVVDPTSITSLPMQDRNILNLALLTPGSVPGAPGTQVTAFSVAGMRSQSNNYTLDGISNNDPQINGPLNGFRIADAIQEFNVQTSIASTDVGRNDGAQVSIVTKSGTNTYHGSLFYYTRNDVLDAAPFFLNRSRQKKNALLRHDFGGTVGGALQRDKTFWFFSIEPFRQRVAQPTTANVPTEAQRAAVTDPVSLKVLQFYPHANTTPASPGGPNWTGTTASVINNQTYFWRIDHNISDKQRLTGHYAWFFQKDLSLQTSPFNGLITDKPQQHSFSLQDTYATGRFVNEFRVGYSRNRTFFQPADVAINPAAIFTDAAGNPLPGFIDTRNDPLDGGMPNIRIAGLTGIGAGTNMPQGRATNSYEVSDDVNLIGPFGQTNHTLKFGATIRHEIANRFLNGNYRGQITFSGFTGFAAGKPIRGSLRTGAGGTFRTWSRSPLYLYAQDSYKPRPNWTINYGLRWELPGAVSEKHNRGSNFVPGVGMMALGSNLRLDVDPTALGRAALILTPVSMRLPSTGQFNNDVDSLGPFLGIAWQPKILPGLFGDGKTVIRTGFRLGYDDVFANIPVNMGLNPPQVLTTTLPTSTYTWGTVLNQNRSLFAADPTVPGGKRGILSFNAWDTSPDSAYAMNYALEIERQLGGNFALDVSYVGTQGRKLGVFVDANQPFVTIVDPTKRGDQTPNTRVFPFPQYAGLFRGTFASNSSYNGMVLELRKRASHGLTLSGSYSYGKSIDDNSSFFGSSADNGSYADTRNRHADRGLSGFDLRQRFVLSYVYELPFGPQRAWLSNTHGVVGQIVGGWQVGGVTSHRTGFPFTIFANAGTLDFSGLNQFADRPDWVPGVNTLATDMTNPDQAFACRSGAGNCPTFTAPLGGEIGNVGRNRFIGPSATEWDFSLLKNFPFSEGRRVQLRAEFFNLFNEVNFNLPSDNLHFTAPGPAGQVKGSAGTIGGADIPRLIQLGLRIEW